MPFLREGVVHQHHWLSERQFLDAVAMGLITPGPVVITATFIGYLVGGLAGAGVATLAIFTPIYLGVVVPGRWFVRHRANPQVKAFVKGATAAAASRLLRADHRRGASAARYGLHLLRHRVARHGARTAARVRRRNGRG